MLTFAVSAIPHGAIVFWEPPLSEQRQLRHEDHKIIIFLFSRTSELERPGLRRMRLVGNIVCCPRLQTSLRCVKREVVGSRLGGQIKLAVLDGEWTVRVFATHSVIHE